MAQEKNKKMAKKCEIDEKELKILKNEYKQLCEDWHLRDKYVLDKLGIAGILFALLGLAIGTIPSDNWLNWLVKCLLLLIGALFSLIICISVMKDVYYRDGTEKLLKCLFDKLCIKNSIEKVCDNKDLKLGAIEFPRKIKLKSYNESSLLKSIRPKMLRDFFLGRGTFKWIIYFYLICFVVFSLAFLATLYYFAIFLIK